MSPALARVIVQRRRPAAQDCGMESAIAANSVCSLPRLRGRAGERVI